MGFLESYARHDSSTHERKINSILGRRALLQMRAILVYGCALRLALHPYVNFLPVNSFGAQRVVGVATSVLAIHLCCCGKRLAPHPYVNFLPVDSFGTLLVVCGITSAIAMRLCCDSVIRFKMPRTSGHFCGRSHHC